MKVKTNEQIFAEVREVGCITEQVINLLKLRSNKNGEDCFDYDLNEKAFDGQGIPCTEEQGMKGLAWLRKYAKTKKCRFGKRERDIVATAKPTDFTFLGFYDKGSLYTHNFIPEYGLNGMEYFVWGGEPIVLS